MNQELLFSGLRLLGGKEHIVTCKSLDVMPSAHRLQKERKKNGIDLQDFFALVFSLCIV